MLIFDIESDGLLDTISTIHCIVVQNVETGEVLRARNEHTYITDMLYMLQDADAICGHNIIAYDIPAIQKLYPWFKPQGKVVDTLVMSETIYPNLFDRDWKMDAKKQGKWISRRYFGSHALAGWGERLGFPKDDYSARMKEKGLDPWAEWSQEMEDYCAIDVASTCELYKYLAAKDWPQESLELEHAVKTVITRQERHGILLDVPAANTLYAHLKGRQLELLDVLQELFPPWEKRLKDFIPKRGNKVKGYKKGVPVEKYKTVEFNPNSEDHVAYILTEQFGWKPKEFTPAGKPQVTDEILSTLKYPNVDKIAEYMTVTKRISQLSDGKSAWLKHYDEGHRIHGRVRTNGAVTGRMTHSSPNMAQVPRVGNPYGKECRSLFVVPKGFKMVGCDAEGLELRALAHYMALYDGGKYAKTVVEGTKEERTDAHTVNQLAIRLNDRDSAKTWFYAFIYGAGDFKLGTIVYSDMDKATRPKPTKRLMVQLGRESRSRLEANLPALGKLTEAVKKKAGKTGFLRGLDGRRIPVRSAHATLNTLLQSAGAVIMKQALILLDEKLRQCEGLVYEFVANVHDEFQMEVEASRAEEVGQNAADCIRLAGDHYNFRCPLAGAFAIGLNWSETH